MRKLEVVEPELLECLARRFPSSSLNNDTLAMGLASRSEIILVVEGDVAGSSEVDLSDCA